MYTRTYQFKPNCLLPNHSEVMVGEIRNKLPNPKPIKTVIIHKFFKSLKKNPVKICPMKMHKPETNKNHNLFKLYVYFAKSDINPALIRPMHENIDSSATCKFCNF